LPGLTDDLSHARLQANLRNDVSLEPSSFEHTPVLLEPTALLDMSTIATGGKDVLCLLSLS